MNLTVDTIRILASTAFCLIFFTLGYYAGLSDSPLPCVCEVHE
jgi:hypothetical protein